jgi:hypothetical protein
MQAVCYWMPKLIFYIRIYNIFLLNNSFFQVSKVVTLRKSLIMQELKQKLHKLIDSCNDELLLEEARAVLESTETANEFFDELDEDDRDSFLEGEDEHDTSVTHHRLMHQFEAWKKK